jgi:hypothetical protein
MNKVPITSVISSWLAADKKIAEQCIEEICEYDSESAYKGYMLGFEAGVESQLVKDDDASKIKLLTKQDIADGFKEFKSDTHFKIAVSEDDCVRYISSSEQYWFYAGAMWLIRQLNRHE